MRNQNAERIQEVIAYIEAHLHEKTDLNGIAKGVHYSKYHLHRMFTDTVGITLHDYVQRRQLTEAARLLVCSDKPVLEIALTAGFESQQAFTDRFKAMYKQPPAKYREGKRFYPLQLPCSLNRNMSHSGGLQKGISYVRAEDIPDWMRFAALVIDGFPGFEEKEHLEQLLEHTANSEALLLRDAGVVVGAAACSKAAGSIDFLGIHPQYRRLEAAGLLLDFMLRNLLFQNAITITTFREGDRADTGQRRLYQELGFSGAELLTEFGYPVQRLTLEVR